MTDIRSFTIPSKPRSENLQGSGTVVYSGGGGSSSGSGGGGSIDLSGYAKLTEDNMFLGENTFRSLVIDNTRSLLHLKSDSKLKSSLGYNDVNKCFVILHYTPNDITTYKELNIYDDGRFEFDNNKIYHAGNSNNFKTDWKASQIILGEGAENNPHTVLAGILEDGVYILSDDPQSGFIPNLTVAGKIYADGSYLVYNEGNSNRLDVPWRAEMLTTGSLVFGEQDNEINARDYGDLYVGFRNTNMVYIGGSCKVGIGMNPSYKLDINGDVRSNVFFQAGNFASGWTGNGSRMEANGNMECSNLFVRGSLNVYELLINQVNATNGSLAVTDSGKVDSVSGNTITLTGDNNNFNTFRVGDLLKCQKFTGKTVKLYTVMVYAITNLDVTFMYITGGTGINVVEKGDILVRWNSNDENRKGLLYLTSSDSGAPFMDVMYDGKSYLRLGNLSGIGNLSGYGIVGRDKDLNNVFSISTSGKSVISGWEITKDSLKGGNVVISSAGEIYNVEGSWKFLNDGSARLGYGEQQISYNATTGNIEFGSEVSLNWMNPIDTTNRVVTDFHNEYEGKTTYIDANGIYTGAISAIQINANDIVSNRFMANNSNGKLRTGINVEDDGAFRTYYSETGKTQFEIVSKDDGVALRCYNKEGNITWELGNSGDIIKAGIDYWSNMKLMKTDKDGSNIQTEGLLNGDMYSTFYATKNSGNSAYSGFTTIGEMTSQSPSTRSPITDGWYTPAVKAGFGIRPIDNPRVTLSRVIILYSQGYEVERKAITWQPYI